MNRRGTDSDCRPAGIDGATARAMLDGMQDMVALIDGERVLYANRALVAAQGCGDGAGICRRVGDAPCEECAIAACARGEGGGHIAVVSGKTYECTWKTIPPEGGGLRLLMWHETAAEAVRLLKGQYDKMRRDILYARNVQSSLLPRQLARADGYYFASLYKPCEEMSGDIFDLFRIGRDNIAFYIADVVGHGVTAAMLTVFFSTAVRLEMHPTDLPGKVLSRVHRRFLELGLDEHQYITAFLGRLEISTGRLFWSNAGHICPPVLVDDIDGMTELEMVGLPISRWFAGQEYATMQGRLAPGASLAVYSDGLESLWQDVAQSGSLPEFIAGRLRGVAPERCLDAIWHGAGARQGDRPLRDDTTLMLLHRLSETGIEVRA